MQRVISVIPSKARAERLSAKTLSWIVLSKYPFVVFVEPQDEAEYRKVVPEENLHVIDKNDQGLGYVKSYIADWLHHYQSDVVIKLDDDVRSVNGRGAIPSPERIADLYDRYIDDSLLAFEKYPDLVATSLPYRWELWEPKQWSALNARLQTVYLCKTDYFIGDPRISTFEDFHNYIYIRSKNKLTLRYGLIGINSDVGKAAGGLQSFDRNKMALAEVDLLRELYPALEMKKVGGKTWGIEPVLKGDFFGVKKL